VRGVAALLRRHRSPTGAPLGDLQQIVVRPTAALRGFEQDGATSTASADAL
jgi:hypothetical protein